MSRSVTSMLAMVGLTIASTLCSPLELRACGGRGRSVSYYRPSVNYHVSPSYPSARLVPHSYRPPSHQIRVLNRQPASLAQPGFGQPAPGLQQAGLNQPVASPRASFAGNPAARPNPQASPQFAGSNPSATRSAFVGGGQPAAGMPARGQASPNPLAGRQQATPNRFVGRQAAPQQQAPQQQPQQALQQQPQPRQQPQPAAPSQTPAETPDAEPNAERSALEALAGMLETAQAATPESPSAPQAAAPGHVGTWNARLSNGAQVQLQLRADGSFFWSATNKSGSQSTFQGTYTVADGSLTLVRSNDSQRLAGRMTVAGGNAFSFQLAGNQGGGLNFVRG